MSIHIGIDVGGTNTDAVLIRGREVLGNVKTSTTEDVTTGIVESISNVLQITDINPESIAAVMIGTTHFTNAVVEAKHLLATGVVRLCGPTTRALPPTVDWPNRLKGIVQGTWYCSGGNEFDGRPIGTLDEDEIRRVAGEIRERGLEAVALSSVFSPINAAQEENAMRVLAEELGDIPISLSNEIGRIGFLERENATIINACLRGLADRIVRGFEKAVARFGITAPLYLSQNDGTLMSSEYTYRYPVATFASGPTNSMRGAAFLSGETDCAVIDIGGTTSDIGILRHGFPREASLTFEIGGVRTNFRMPDVLSLGIGGGSIVRTDGGLRIGPDSVGFHLTERALVFGGDVLTATDLAVAGGRAEIGDASRVAKLDPDMVEEGLAWIDDEVSTTLDRMKTERDAIPVVLVGGGSILLGDQIEGASRVIRPGHHAVANAIGAAIAQVGGQVDRIVSLNDVPRDQALAAARRDAEAKCVSAGADPDTVTIVDIDEVPLAYLPSNAVRIKVKAVGDLKAGD